MSGLPFNTKETVDFETLACAATSTMVIVRVFVDRVVMAYRCFPLILNFALAIILERSNNSHITTFQ